MENPDFDSWPGSMLSSVSSFFPGIFRDSNKAGSDDFLPHLNQFILPGRYLRHIAQEESLDKQKISENDCGGISLTCSNGFIDSWLILRPFISYFSIIFSGPNLNLNIPLPPLRIQIAIYCTESFSVAVFIADYCVLVV